MRYISKNLVFTAGKPRNGVTQVNRRAEWPCYVSAVTDWGVSALATYRLYRLDGAGRISAAEWIEAADDEQARLRARGQSSGRYELWERNRLVHRETGRGD